MSPGEDPGRHEYSLISAALFPNSIPFKAYVKAVSFPHHAIVCEQDIDEMKRVFYRKFPA